jgi:hypothetical protein
MRSADFYFPGAESLMPLEVPLLKVSRPVAACQRCRSAKIKCDGKLPACTACERSGRAQQCSSGNSQFAPGKERSYVSTLEAKVERLEKKIAEARRRRQSSITMFDYASPITPLSRTSTMESNGKPRDRKARFRRELGTVDELVSDFGFLTVNATARDYQYGFSNSISYARLIIAAASKEPLPSGMKKELPPLATSRTLVQLYVDSILPLHPILNEQEVYNSLHAMHDDGQDASNMQAWTLRMILAISSIMQSRQRGDSPYTDAIGHVCAALEIADHVLHPGSIWSIQAMLLLAQYSLLDPAHLDSWTLIGAASRAMVDLGLHQNPSKSSKTNKLQLELRRRIYHCVYCLDRATSIVMTRAFSFSDDSANVGKPFTLKPASPSAVESGKNMWTRGSNELSLAYITWRQMQSSWYTELFQSGRTPWLDPYTKIWKFYNNMSNWFKNLPASTPAQLREFLELDLLFSYVSVLSPNPRCPVPNEHAQRLIMEHSTAYADMVKRLQTEPASKLSPFTFYDAIRVYTVARQYVDTLMANLNALLQPSCHSSYTTTNADSEAEIDPLGASTPAAPPLPTPVKNESSTSTISRAIDTINTFLAILSYFGHRFGYVSEVSWHEKFQKESQPLLTQLHNRLQLHQQSNSPESYFWSTSQSAPLSTSPSLQHRVSASFYPSPAATTYSPNFVSQDIDSAALEPSWQGSSAAASAALFGVAPPVHDFANGALLNEFGIGNMAAWETLPGGRMNARFS